MNYSMIKPPGTPKNLCFFQKNVIFRPFLIQKTLIFEYVTQNNHRKLMAKTWRKNRNWFNSIHFSQYQYGRKTAIFGATMQIFSMIHHINMKKFPAKFYNNNLNGSIFEFFSIPKIGYISENITDREER